MIAMEINLTITITYLQLETRIVHYRNNLQQLFYRQINKNVFFDIYLNCRIHLLKMKIQFCQF